MANSRMKLWPGFVIPWTRFQVDWISVLHLGSGDLSIYEKFSYLFSKDIIG